MAANDDIYELTVSHSIYLERYKAQVVSRMMEILDSTEADIQNQLVTRLDRIIELGFDTGPATTEHIMELVAAIGEVRQEAYLALGTYLKEELAQLAQYEVAWQTAMLNEAITFELSLGAPTAEVVNAAVFSKPFNGALFEDWVDGMAPSDLVRIERAITIGVMEGETVQKITQRVLGTRGLGFEDGITAQSRRGAEAVARTAVNHTVTQAREQVYQANEDIIQQIRWTSTIDGRTTLICISRDGQTFPVDSGPRPPAHWKCRSTTMPIIDGMKLVGDRPTITDTRNRRQREIDFRAQAKSKAGSDWRRMSAKQRQAAVGRERQKWARENIGGVPKASTYQQWLKKQSAAFQDELLGPTRGKLFRQGGLTVDKFIDRSGHKYTLDELRKREAAAFKKAKL